jgi:cytochrome c-type biogenesis protein CcmH
MRWLAALGAIVALAACPVALASEDHPTSYEIQTELWCDDCQTTLAEASAVTFTPHAIQFIDSRIAAGATKSEIKREAVKKFYGHLSLAPAKPTPAEDRPTLADLEGEVMCPVCNTTLDQSSSPAARQIESFIRARIAAGDSKNEIKDRLVAEYGPQILAAPPAKGFNLLAWLLPFVALLGGALVLALLAWHWSRNRERPPPGARLSPALERRVDDELARFDEG